MTTIEPYENTLDLSALRREVRAAWDTHAEFALAIQTLPDMASPGALWHLVDATMNVRGIDLWSIGKEAQRRYGLEAVPPKTEYENAAGLWIIIRDALRAKIADAHNAHLDGTQTEHLTIHDAETPANGAS